MPQFFRQIVVDDQRALDEAVGLGVAGALETAGREIDHEMLAHLVDHGLDVLLLAGLQGFLGKPDIFPAALQIDQECQKARCVIAQQIIDQRPPERIEPPHHMQEYFEQPVKEPEKHRQSSFLHGLLARGSRPSSRSPANDPGFRAG